MVLKDPRIDVYIEKSAPFARPILSHLRKLIHQACPEVTETIKWGFMAFEFKGPLLTVAAFKQHAVVGFWKYELMKDPKGFLQERSSQGGSAMGNLGRILTLEDLPPDRIILAFIRQAMKLNKDGVRLPLKPKPNVNRLLTTPDFFVKALRKAKLTATFNSMSYSHRKEYIQWLNEAKKEETRERRMAEAISLISRGKHRNWKYEKGK
jgi:uncharacterized protein YdeI (YjbR/CyaY-like superfamily)